MNGYWPIGYWPADTAPGWYLKFIKNKKIIQKTGSTWYLIIYDNDGITQLVNKALKDVNGNDINDLTAGVLAQEMISSV